MFDEPEEDEKVEADTQENEDACFEETHKQQIEED